MEISEYDLVTHGNIAYTMFFSLVFLLVIAVNVILLIIFIRNPVLISPSQLLYINLSCTNITLALFSMTFGVVTLISNKWIFPGLVCHLVGFFNNCFIHMVMFTAFHVLNERYHYRMNSRRHCKLYTTKRIGINIAVFWVVCTVLSILPLVPGLDSYTYHSNVGTCHSPTSLLGIIPTITNSIYIVLWLFITFNLVTLPRVSLPDALKHKRSKGATFLPQLVTSGVYTLAAVASVIFVVLDKAGVLTENITVALERTSLLLTYSSMILMPISVVSFSPELRLGLKELLKKGGDLSKYEQIDQSQRQLVSPEFPKNAAQGQVIYPDKNQMMPPQVRGYPRPVYTRPVRYEVYRPSPADPRCAHPIDPRVPRPVRQVHRSHSTVGYMQRHHRALHTGQRSQSLNRVSEPQNIEMCTMKQSGTSAVPTPTPRSESTVPCDKIATTGKGNTATSSVASSSTVADIVDL